MTIKKVRVDWLPGPQVHDYSSAMSYLGLLYDTKKCRRIVDKLKKAPVTPFKAKDIFRASRLSLLSITNSHVSTDKKKILSKQKLSPILLVRDSRNGKVIIADGYHRMCAVYYFEEDAVIPCHIV
jgi:hypothetical protein